MLIIARRMRRILITKQDPLLVIITVSKYLFHLPQFSFLSHVHLLALGAILGSVLAFVYQAGALFSHDWICGI